MKELIAGWNQRFEEGSKGLAGIGGDCHAKQTVYSGEQGFVHTTKGLDGYRKGTGVSGQNIGTEMAATI